MPVFWCSAVAGMLPVVGVGEGVLDCVGHDVALVRCGQGWLAERVDSPDAHACGCLREPLRGKCWVEVGVVNVLALLGVHGGDEFTGAFVAGVVFEVFALESLLGEVFPLGEEFGAGFEPLFAAGETSGDALLVGVIFCEAVGVADVLA